MLECTYIKAIAWEKAMSEMKITSQTGRTIPAFLIAGTHSGSGKTTITLGLMAALRARGLAVQPFKVGPDFIDPSHHTAVCGRTSRNLDPFMMGEDGVHHCFRSALAGADVAVVEGVMGLFDGMDGSEVSSTAQVARILDIPVLLVIDVHGMSRSAAAIEKGFASFDPRLRLAGSILNRVGSEKHLSMLKSCLSLPVFAALPRAKEMEMKSRHLGLVMGFEKEHDVQAQAAWLERHAAIDEILKLTGSPGMAALDGDGLSRQAAAEDAADATNAATIAVALDEAFCFYYYENLRELERAGARLVYFSPMRDDLPDVDGLYIGGGYPELHAEKLQSGAARRQILHASEAGMPIYGECGGLMYLGESLEDERGSHEMVGALPGKTVMGKRLEALGYVSAEVAIDNPLLGMGRSIRGHEFHYSHFDCDKDARFAYRLQRGKGIRDGRDGLIERNTMGGYLHAHFYSISLERFIESCKAYRRK